MSLPTACARAVERAGGDLSDLEDLLLVWSRVATNTERRADAIRSAVSRAACSCFDDGDANGGGRCTRCYGRLERTR